MKSIRWHLWNRLVVGMGGVWILAGATIYLTVGQRLRAGFDDHLDHLVSEVRLLLPGAELPDGSVEGPRRMMDLFIANSGYYFQVWDSDGLFSDRSPSLGGMQLPRPATIGLTPVYWNCSLSSGEHVRASAVRITILPGQDLSGRESMGTSLNESPSAIQADVVVACNREDLDRALSLVVFGTLGVCAVTALVSALVASVTVGAGLRPLDQLGRLAGEIDTQSLSYRFPVIDLPAELQPIVRGLNELMQRIEAGFIRERRFSSDLAHELRTPVAELRTLAECALRWPDDAESASFHDVLHVANQIQSLLETLLAMARLEQGPTAPKRESLRVYDAIIECWRPLKRDAEGKRLRLQCRVPEALQLNTCVDLFKIILSNLLANAVAYSPAASCILVTGADPAGGPVELTVENPAEGITPTDVAHFFDRFWRQDPSRSIRGHHGLGLSLARLCAETLGYRLTAEMDEARASVRFRLATAAD